MKRLYIQNTNIYVYYKIIQYIFVHIGASDSLLSPKRSKWKRCSSCSTNFYNYLWWIGNSYSSHCNHCFLKSNNYRCVDKTTGKVFFYNRHSRNSTWTVPPDFDAPDDSALRHSKRWEFRWVWNCIYWYSIFSIF